MRSSHSTIGSSIALHVASAMKLATADVPFAFKREAEKTRCVATDAQLRYATKFVKFDNIK